MNPRALEPESLAEAVQQERAKLAEQARAETAQFVEERRAKAERFFNQPQSLADFRYWAKEAYWTIEEATALAFGKEPWVVNLKSVSPHAGFSPFPANYVRLKDLVERAQEVGKLGDQVMPSDFIAWAKRTGIDYPSELEAELVAQGQLVDWKTAHDELKAQYERMEGVLRKSEAKAASTEAERDRLRQETVDWKAAHNDLKRKHDHLVAERDTLKARVSSLEAQQAELQGEKDSGPRERETHQKMILGMAMSGSFGYDPNAKKSPAISKIVKALARSELDVGEKTVREKLREAAKKLGLLKSSENGNKTIKR